MFNWLAFAADRPTIAEQAPQDLWEFLADFPKSFEAQLFAGLMLAGVAGMAVHYTLKWARKEIKQNPFCYIACNFRTTCLSFFAYVSLSVGEMLVGAFTPEDVFIGWKWVLWHGFTNGLAIDVILNKTERARWTTVERVRKRRGEPL